MSAELVNLRKARKAKQRAEEDLRAATNRLHFGRSRDAREADAATSERDARELDGKKLER